MKRWMLRVWWSGAVTVFFAVISAGCAVPLHKNQDEALRLGRSGISILVDSSVYLKMSGGRSSISVPENAQIAVELVKAAEDSLGEKDYAVQGASILSVGAQLKPDAKMNVKTVGGVLMSPEAVGKPVIVRPDPGDPAVTAGINAVFLWSLKPSGHAPKNAATEAPSGGVLLLSALGSNTRSLKPGSDEGVSITTLVPGDNADSMVELLLLDRATGETVWLDRGSSKGFTPEAVAKEAGRLLEALPSAK